MPDLTLFHEDIAITLPLPKKGLSHRQYSSWVIRAFEFKYASEILIESYEKAISNREFENQKYLSILLPCMLCMGICIENLLKGLIVLRDPSVIPQSGKIDFAHHGLLKFFEQLKIDLTNEEKTFVARLKDTIEWGKYPITKNPEKYLNHFDDKKPLHPHSGIQAWQIKEHFKKIFKKILLEYGNKEMVSTVHQNP